LACTSRLAKRENRPYREPCASHQHGGANSNGDLVDRATTENAASRPCAHVTNLVLCDAGVTARLANRAGWPAKITERAVVLPGGGLMAHEEERDCPPDSERCPTDHEPKSNATVVGLFVSMVLHHLRVMLAPPCRGVVHLGLQSRSTVVRCWSWWWRLNRCSGWRLLLNLTL